MNRATNKFHCDLRHPTKKEMKMEKSRVTALTQEEVDSFLKENNISVMVTMEEGYDKDDNWVEPIYNDEGYFEKHGEDAVKIEKSWGFSSPSGFHTFTGLDELTEIQAQTMVVIFHKLYEEYDVAWSQAEALAYAYVTSEYAIPYVPQTPITEEEQEEVRKKLLDCIESGNVVIPDGVLPKDENVFNKTVKF